MIIKCVNAFYFRMICDMGGIESHLYYLSRKYKNRDITIFYKTCGNQQLERLKRYVRCIKFEDNMQIECEKMFCCFNREILDNVIKGKKYVVLHGDYKELIKIESIGSLPLTEGVEYLGVSQLVCDSWKETTKLDAKNIYEPIFIEKNDRPLHFILASRLSKEKGIDQLNKLIDTLNLTGKKWLLDIYTNREVNTNNPNIRVFQPRLDIVDYYPIYDAMINISLTEGYGLSVVEALCKGIPVITTHCPVFDELGLNETNSVYVPFDLDCDKETIEKIKNIRKLKVKYKPKEDKWGSVLVNKPNSYKPIHCITTDAYIKLNVKDRELGYIPAPNTELWLTKERFEELKNAKDGIEFVKEIED